MVSEKSKKKPPKETWLPEIGGEVATDERGVSSMQAGAVVMKPKLSHRDELVGTIILAAITALWNVVVWLGVVQLVLDWQIGEASPSPKDILGWIVFVLTGLALIGCVFYCLLALFNPRLTLTLSSRSVPLGGVMQLRWEFSGRSSMIRQLTIMLYGRECASYEVMDTADSNHRQLDAEERKGTDENTFFEMEVLSTRDRREIGFGEIGLVMPSDSMHSFEAYWNRIVWKIEVHGDIKWWPDVEEAFKIAVLPAEMEKA